MRLSMPAPLRVLRDVLGLGSHAFICAGNNVAGDSQQLSRSYLGSVLRDVRISAGVGLVRACACITHVFALGLPPISPPPPPFPLPSQVKNVGAGRLELNYCVPLLQQVACVTMCAL